MTTRTPFVGGNWKMNTDALGAGNLARAVADGLRETPDLNVVLFPPFPYLLTVASVLRERAPHSRLALGAQDVYHQPDGAFTGEVSTAMLLDCACTHVLTGHSERRHVLGESDALVNRKTLAALQAGLHVVLCVGETLDERERAETHAVNERQVKAGLAGVTPAQMADVVVAYEPVWAIGTGRTATPDDAQEAHARIRVLLSELFNESVASQTRIIYGGSVKPANAAELFAQPDIDGGLIGGASLKPDDFLAIARAAPARA